MVTSVRSGESSIKRKREREREKKNRDIADFEIP